MVNTMIKTMLVLLLFYHNFAVFLYRIYDLYIYIGELILIVDVEAVLMMTQIFAIMMMIFAIWKHIFTKMVMLIVTTHSLVLTADDKKTITEDNVALL